MPPTPDLADAQWLVSPDAEPALVFAADEGVPLHRRAAQLRQVLTSARTHLALQQAELRQRGRAKFRHSDVLFFTRQGLEQSTDEWIAAYKAARFRDAGPIAELCCGIGGDLIGLANRGAAVGLDRDPVVTLFAGANLRNSAAGLYRESRAICGDAENVDLSAYSGWHIDPDRRPHGRRTTGVEQMLPSRESIERMLTRNPHAAVKLAPAASPPREWQEQAELEWISRDRECRQQVAWFGNLAQSPGVRRASLLDASGALIGQIVGTSISLPDPTARVEEYIFEPDPAVLAAGLAGQLAQALQVVPIAREIPYLTSAEPLAHPLLTAFRVLEVLPLDEKRLAAMLRARRIGRLEIKCRGVHLVPEEFRRRLRLGGDRSGVLLITPHGGRTVAILAQRLASRGGARRREG